MTEDTGAKKPKKKRIFLKILLGVLVLLIGGGIYFYNNFNKLLSEALMKSFNSNIISDVYELSFQKLRVDLLSGNIHVMDVVMQPREKPLNDYPYINSSFILKTKKIELTNVKIMVLLRENKLELDKIEILEPDVDLNVEGKVKILFPVKDTTQQVEKKTNKKFIDSFSLQSFQLKNAKFYVNNSFEERRFTIKGFNLTINDIHIDQFVGKDVLIYNHVEWKIGEFEGVMKKGPIREIAFKDYRLSIDSLNINKSLDTLIFNYAKFTAQYKSLNILTADSLSNLRMNSFDLDSKNKSVKIEGFEYRPNYSFAYLQRKYKYDNTDVSLKVGKIDVQNLNFDSMVYANKIFIDEVSIADVDAKIYKDNTKMVDMTKFPPFLGQTIANIGMPLEVKKLKVTGANIENTEIIKDTTPAIVKINRGEVLVENITNLDKSKPLKVNVSAYIVNKVHFKIDLAFSYTKKEFSLNCKFDRFPLKDMNPVLMAYTPGKINNGVADEISFIGTVNDFKATGTMKFLYHDLDVDLKLEKAKWLGTIGAFAANAIVSSSNPPNKDSPPKVVAYSVERKRTSGFINSIIKSALAGLKETVYMSKENRKAYKKQKKEMKKGK